MTKAERVLSLLEALQDRPSATGPELELSIGSTPKATSRETAASTTALNVGSAIPRPPGTSCSAADAL